jgi:hypothetical protein
MDKVQTKDIHIAVLNKRFRTSNHQSGGFIWWEENEVVHVTKHNVNQESHLWYCVKLEESVTDMDIFGIVYNGLVVAKNHLDFVDVNWRQIK